MSIQVKALSTILHDGKEYSEGDTLELTQEQADALIGAHVATSGRAEKAQEGEVVKTQPAGDGLDELGFQVLKDRAVEAGIDVTELKSKDALREALRAKAA